MNDLQFRPLTADDCYEVKRLINIVWRIAYKNIFPAEVFDNKDKKLQKSSEKLENKLKNNEIFGFVAIFENKMVGVSIGSYESEYEYYAELGYSDLQVLYILPEFQGQHIGTRFFEKITNVLKDASKNKMVICALEDNHKARKVYEKWGGKLDVSYTKDYVVLGKSYKDVFYLYDL